MEAVMKKHRLVLPPSAFELVTMVLSIISLGIILLLQFMSFEAEQKQLLLHLDTGICLVLLANFFYCLAGAANKKQFLKTHWIDFIAAIPAVEVLRYGRIVQVLRVLRILRATDDVVRHVRAQNNSTMLASLLLVSFVVLGVSAFGVLIAEAAQPDANIKTAEDAIWWALVTISTVGYGEYYPVTAMGRIISSVVIITGVSVFAGLSGVVASSLLTPKNSPWQRTGLDPLPANQAVQAQLTDLHQEMAELKAEIKALTAMLNKREE